MTITGCNFVRASRHGLQVARQWWPKTSDRFEIRRQALKLRFWDERHLHSQGRVLDLSYESIKGVRGERDVFEARIDEPIGGQENIRIVFWDPPKSWEPCDVERRPLRIIWILEVFPKRRNEWTHNELTRFAASRLMLRRRCYGR